MNVIESARNRVAKQDVRKQEASLTDAPIFRKVRRMRVKLEQRDGRWWVMLGSSSNSYPATDAEVNLWLDLQEAKG